MADTHRFFMAIAMVAVCALPMLVFQLIPANRSVPAIALVGAMLLFHFVLMRHNARSDTGGMK